MADMLLAVRLTLENGQYKAEIVNSDKLTRQFSQEGKKGFEGLSEAASRAPGPVGNVSRSLQRLRSTTALVAAGFSGLVAGIGAFALAVLKGTSIADDHEKAQRRLAAQIRATGAAAGKSARELDEQADSLSRSTLFNDDEIRAAQSRLLVFTGVTGTLFDRAIEGATDLATVTGSLDGAVRQIGRALENPKQGFESLREAGIEFLDTEKEVIQSLVETGRRGEALELILAKIEGRLGGTAQDEAQGYSEAIHRLSEEWENLLEAMSNTSVLSAAANELAAVFNGIRRRINPNDQEQVDDLVEERMKLLEAINKAETSPGFFGGGTRLFNARERLVEVERDLEKFRAKREADLREEGRVAQEAERRRLEREQQDRERFLAEKAVKDAEARDKETEALEQLRQQMLDADEAALKAGLQARQIALKTEVETAEDELTRSRDRQLITDRQYFDARRDLVDAAFSAEIDLRERLLQLADQREKAIVAAQIEDLKAQRLRAIAEISDAEEQAQAQRLVALQQRASGAITRAQQSASVVDARVSTGALTPEQGRSQLAESASAARNELGSLRAEILALLEKSPDDPALIGVLGQVQDALRQTRTEAEIVADRIVGSFTGGAIDAVASFADGTKSFGEAWEDAGQSIVRSITRIVAELLVLAAAQRLIEGVTGGAFTLSGGQLARTATLAEGGLVRGPGGPKADAINARLSNGEFVMQAEAVSKFGVSFMETLNAGFLPRTAQAAFAEGGFVGPNPASSTGGLSLQVINQGEPMRVSRTEQSRGPSGQDLYRVFVEPALKRDIAQGGDVIRMISGALGTERVPAGR